MNKNLSVINFWLVFALLESIRETVHAYTCTSCPIGKFTGDCNASFAGTCTNCTTACVDGSTYESTHCTPVTNRACAACSTCVLGSSYVSSECVAAADRVCSTVSNPCFLGFYKSSETGLCTACGACTESGYSRVNCGGGDPGACVPGLSAFALVADYTSKKIRKVDLVTANVTTIASSGGSPISVAVSCDGTYAIHTSGHALVKLNLTTGVSVVWAGVVATPGTWDASGTSAKFNTPFRLRMSTDCSYILVAESVSRVIRKVDLSTVTVSRLAGLFSSTTYIDGPALTSTFSNPVGLAIAPIDGSYTLVLDDNKVRKITLTDPMTTTTVAGDTSTVAGLTGSTNGIGTQARFSSPRDIEISPSGSFAVIADVNNNMLRKIDLNTYEVTTLVSFAVSYLNGILPRSLSFLASDANLLFTGTLSTYNKVLMFSTDTGEVSEVAGIGPVGSQNGVGSMASFNLPYGISVWKCQSGYFMPSTVCMPCSSTCSPGYFMSAACTRSADITCTPCSACGAGSYASAPCLAASDTTCSACPECPIGTTQNVSCGGTSTGTCVTCAPCSSPRETRANCSGQSAGTCVLGSNGFALVSEYLNQAVRKIDLVNATVTTVGTCNDYMKGISVSCNGSFAVYICHHAIMMLDLSSGISTVLAGDKVNSGNQNGIGTSARFSSPADVKFSKTCTYVLVVETNNRLIRMVDIVTQTVSTVAGNYTTGYADGPALSAQFSDLNGLAFSPDGSFVLVVDKYRIRKLTMTGTKTVSTLAGQSAYGIYADGTGTAAVFDSPSKISISSDGLFALVTDVDIFSIRKIILATAVVSTLVVLPGNAYGISILPGDNFALVSIAYGVFRVSTSSGALALLAGDMMLKGFQDGMGSGARLGYSTSIDVWSSCTAGFYRAGNTPCAACSAACTLGVSYETTPCTPTTNRVCTACSKCVIGSTYATSECTLTTNRVCSPVVSPCGVGFYNNKSTALCTGCGVCLADGYARFNCSGSSPGSCSPGSNAFALVSDSVSKLVRKVDLVTANVTTVGSAATVSLLSVVVSCDGTYAIHTDGHSLKKLDLSTGVRTTWAGAVSTVGSTDANGTSARFNSPFRIRMSNDCSYILVAESVNRVVRKVDLSTVAVSRLAGVVSTAAAGYLDGPALTSKFSTPVGVAISPGGDYMLVLDDNKIRKVTLDPLLAMTTTTIAGDNSSVAGIAGFANGVGTRAKFSSPREIEISPDGSFAVVADSNNHMIRRVDMATYEVTTLVSFDAAYGNPIVPKGICFAASGMHVFVAGTATGYFKMWMASVNTGEVTFVAGSASAGSQNGVGGSATFNVPYGISVVLNACPPGYYRDVTCKACADPCASGVSYESVRCTPTQDRVCSACNLPCTVGLHYESSACTPTQDRVCSACSPPCTDGLNYESSACTSSQDRVCSACSPPCTVGLNYESRACTSTANRQCSPCGVCMANFMYKVSACNATSDTVCAACSTCPSGRYQIQACNATSDVACATCSTCSNGKYQSSPCTAVADTVCTPCQVCSQNGYFKQGCGNTSAGYCTRCSNAPP